MGQDRAFSRKEYLDILNLGDSNYINLSLQSSQDSILKYLLKKFEAESAVFFVRDTDDLVFDRNTTTLMNLSWQYTDSYIQHYNQIDPFLRLAPKTGAYRDTDLIRLLDWKKHEYFNEFIKPQNINHLLVLYLQQNSQLLGHIGIHRHDHGQGFSQKDLFKAQFLARVLTLNLIQKQTADRALKIERQGGILAKKGSIIPALCSHNWNLTPKELEVAHYICQGLSNKEIGTKLYISLPTVTTHISHIFEKLGVNSRVKLICALQS
jgi:DNA-binding CsgD family transcriptional regulator